MRLIINSPLNRTRQVSISRNKHLFTGYPPHDKKGRVPRSEIPGRKNGTVLSPRCCTFISEHPTENTEHAETFNITE